MVMGWLAASGVPVDATAAAFVVGSRRPEAVGAATTERDDGAETSDHLLAKEAEA